MSTFQNIVGILVLCTVMCRLATAQMCFCHEMEYDRALEPYRYDDCTSCTECGQVVQIDCIQKCCNPLAEVEDDGVCCPICPTGPNCEIEGVVIPHGEQRQVNDQLCECEPLMIGYNPHTASCIPAPPLL